MGVLLLTYAEVIGEIVGRVRSRATGTLFITTSDQHSVRLSYSEGTIRSFVYRNLRGIEAVRAFRHIQQATVKFNEGFVFPDNDPVASTEELIRSLGGQL